MSPREPFDVIDGGREDEALFAPTEPAPELGVVLPFPAQAYTYAHGPRAAMAIVDGHGRVWRFADQAALYAEVMRRHHLDVARDRAMARRAAEAARCQSFDAAPVRARAQFIAVDWIERLLVAAAPYAPWAAAAGCAAALAAFVLGIGA